MLKPGAATRDSEDEKWKRGEEFFSAAARLSLVLKRGEGPVIDSVVMGSFTAINAQPAQGIELAGIVSQKLPAWLREEISLDELGASVISRWPASMQGAEAARKGA